MNELMESMEGGFCLATSLWSKLLSLAVHSGYRWFQGPVSATASKGELFLDAQCICYIFSATKPSSAGTSNLGWYFGDQEGNYPLG